MGKGLMPCGGADNTGVTGKDYGRLKEYAAYRSQQSPNRAVRRQAAKLAKRIKRK
jgi:hypothetical protein